MAEHIPISEMMTAEFKRDYIALAALIAFAVILLGEAALAFSIPWYLHRENALADQVAKLKLTEEFDSLRRGIASARPATEAAKAELQILEWNSNLLADYLRTEVESLSPEEVAELRRFIRSSTVWMGKIRSGKSFSRVNQLDTRNYIDQLIPEQGAKTDDAK